MSRAGTPRLTTLLGRLLMVILSEAKNLGRYVFNKLRRSFAALKMAPLLNGRRGRGWWVGRSANDNHP
jgi:hypothetical protein